MPDSWLAHRETRCPARPLEPVVIRIENAPRLGDVDRRARVGRRAARSATRDRCGPSSTRPRLRHALRRRLLARAFHLLGHLRFGDRLVGARPPRPLSSPSPSSFWIVRICSRSRCLRLVSSIDSRVRASISRDTFSTSMRCDSSSSSLSSRVLRSKVSSSACFSSALMSIRPAMKSASRTGPSTPCRVATISSGTCGRSCRISIARSLRLRARPSMSTSIWSESSMSCTRAAANG